MSLAEPSGSSPPEKPPGRNTIWAWPRALATASMDSAMPVAVRLLDDQDLRLGPGVAHGLGRVILAVRAGEDGDEHLGLGSLDERRACAAVALVGQGGDVLLLLVDVAGVDRLQLVLVCSQQLVPGDGARPASVRPVFSRGGAQGQARSAAARPAPGRRRRSA